MDILGQLRAEGKFFEHLHLAWGLVEFKADECILMAYALSSQDVRAEPLLELSVSKKLRLLRNMCVLSADDFAIISEFRLKRNNLFHTESMFALSLEKEEKERIMELGKRATEIMYRVSDVLRERQAERRVYLKNNPKL